VLHPALLPGTTLWKLASVVAKQKNSMIVILVSVAVLVAYFLGYGVLAFRQLWRATRSSRTRRIGAGTLMFFLLGGLISIVRDRDYIAIPMTIVGALMISIIAMWGHERWVVKNEDPIRFPTFWTLWATRNR